LEVRIRIDVRRHCSPNCRPDSFNTGTTA
jgi:hypothetical protein